MKADKMDDKRISEQVGQGLAELVPDPDRPGSWTLRIDGVGQSYVDMSDPTFLLFEYAHRVAAVIETVKPKSVLHLGGGAMCLPRFIAATFPDARQVVVEHDELLLSFVNRVLPLPAGSRIDVLVSDARLVVESAPLEAFDLIIADVSEVAQMPPSVASIECAAEVAARLRPQGIYVVNVPDLPDLAFARRVAATLLRTFTDVCAVAEPVAVPGKRFANAVFAASTDFLPLERLSELAQRGPFAGKLMSHDGLVDFAYGALPVSDAADVLLDEAGL